MTPTASTKPQSIQDIDRKLLKAYGKLHGETNVVLRHRLVQKIDALLDDRLGTMRAHSKSKP